VGRERGQRRHQRDYTAGWRDAKGIDCRRRRKRVYAKYFDRDQTRQANGTPIPDSSDRGQAGFRADWVAPSRTFTLQGDVYQSDIEQQPGGSRDIGGGNILARWMQRIADGGTLQVQAYYDRVERNQPGAIREILDIFDVELQHTLDVGARDQALWGATYRRANEDLQNLAPAAFGFLPESRNLTWYSAFAQYEWRLRSDFALTLGVKAEHNDYTGLEWLPSARAAWTPDADRLVWGAVSRAVRAPSRIDREFFIPARPPFFLAGGPNFAS
jgi:iron complex outermembrane recepter protein